MNPGVVPAVDRRTMPAWVLRLGLAAVAGSLVALLRVDGAAPSIVVILGLVALAAVFTPASPASAILGGGVAVMLVVHGDGFIRPAVLAAITLVHLLHVLTGVVAVIPSGSRIQLRALARPALRFAWIQTAALTLAALSWQLPRAPTTPALLEITALLAVIAAAALVATRLLRG